MGSTAMGKIFDVEVSHFVDDGVWVGTSEDIKGLTVEADSLEAFIEALLEVSSELLAHNHGLSGAQLAQSTLRVHKLHVRNQTGEQARRVSTKARRRSPQLVFQDPVEWFGEAAVA